MEHDEPKRLVADTVIHWIKQLHEQEDEALATVGVASWVGEGR